MAFNEKFGFERPDQLKEDYKKGLKMGLPYPVLIVAEYIAVDAAYYNQAGFGWGLSYRQAGFYGSFSLVQFCPLAFDKFDGCCGPKIWSLFDEFNWSYVDLQ